MIEDFSTRLRDLENKFHILSIEVSAMVAKIDTLTSVGKGILIISAAMVGLDVSNMVGA
jgi:hypothetical protein